MLPNIQLGWLGQVTNCFLIREPREMLTSLMKKLPNPTLTDTALPQQLRLFDHVRELTGETPPVIDSTEVLRTPAVCWPPYVIASE